MIDLHGRVIRSRIERWRDAGLIDPPTAQRLLAFETSRGVAGGAAGVPVVTGIGAFALALGIVALVSANWEALSLWVKLGGHIGLNLALGAAVWLGLASERLGWRAREVLLMVLSASTLALLAHVGQAFHLQGGVFGLLAAWLALVSPFTLRLARGAANRWLWTAGLFATVGAGLGEHADALIEARLLTTSLALFVVAGYAAPLVARGPWGRLLNRVMLAVLVVATSVAQIGWRASGGAEIAAIRVDVLVGTGVALLGLAATHFLLARGGSGRPWLTAFVVASPVYAALPLVVGGVDSAVAEAVGLCLYWVAISQLAHAAASRGLYVMAVLVIAARVFAVFVEAFGGLLLTGVGLIAGGLLLLGFGYGVRRLMARAKEGARP